MSGTAVAIMLLAFLAMASNVNKNIFHCQLEAQSLAFIENDAVKAGEALLNAICAVANHSACCIAMAALQNMR